MPGRLFSLLLHTEIINDWDYGKGKKIPPQEASRTNPVAKPEDTKGGINNKVSSGLIGKKLAEQAEENEEMPMHHLIADKDYPSGIREWMITSPSELKYPTLVVAAAMLSVILHVSEYSMCMIIREKIGHRAAGHRRGRAVERESRLPDTSCVP